MTNSIPQTFQNTLIALWGLIVSLVRRFPLFFIATLLLVYFLLRYLTLGPLRMTLVLCTIITFVSILVYVATNNYAQTALSFILGLFVVFSIEWTIPRYVIFITFYLAFTFFIFMINSVRAASKVETLLKQAASFYDVNSAKETYKVLHDISSSPTKNHMLSGVEKAEIIRYFCFNKVSIKLLKNLLNTIEVIKVVAQVGHLKAAKFVYSAYLISKQINREDIQLITKISDAMMTMPCTPEDFFEIFESTKRHIITGAVSLQNYLHRLQSLLNEGYSKEEIIEKFKIYSTTS